MKRKKILILMHYMEIGGAEISLIGLLNAINTKKYDVDLFLYSHQGELMELIPDGINILPEVKKYSTIEKPMKEVLKMGYLDIIFARLYAKIRAKIYYKKSKSKKEDFSVFHYIYKYVTPFLPKIEESKNYDLAISFLSPFQILRDKVKSKKKVGWIHTDFNILEINAKEELPVWDSCNHIMSISESITTSFLKVFPSLESKVILMENILSPEFVRNRASNFETNIEMPSENGVVKLLSVGRYCRQKNFDNLPYICKKMIEDGYKIKWYIIGYGGDEQKILNHIKLCNMEDNVILLGKKNNPYPYMKSCDIYVQPSRYEGKSVTVREAQMLCKPVAITDYPTSSSQIKNGVDGVIVPMENEKCAKGIEKFIDDIGLQESIISYLRENDYGNERQVEKLIHLF